MKICTPACLSALASLFCLLQAPAVSAANAQTGCTAATEGELAFGPYASIEIDALTAVSVTCPDGVPYTLALDNGLHYAAPHRRLQNGTGFLNYELYSDAAETARWGENAGSQVVRIGNGAAQSTTVYGRVFADQPLLAGSYTDTVTVTVKY